MSCPTITKEYITNAVRESTIPQYLLFVCCVVSAIGSFIVLLSLYKTKALTPHLLLVASLCLADLILTTESGLYLMVFNKSADPLLACQINSFFTTASVLISITSCGMIIAERYLVIVRQWQTTNSQTGIAMAIAYTYIFTVSLIAALEPEYVDMGVGLVCKQKYCSRAPVMIGSISSSIGLLCLLVFSAAYCPYEILKIYKVGLGTVDSMYLAENRRAIEERKLKERKIFIRLYVITSVFIVMISPLAITAFYEVVTGNLAPREAVLLYYFAIGTNSSLNPILLYNFDISVQNRVDLLFGWKDRRLGSSPKISSLQKLSSNAKNAVNGLAGTLNIKDTVKMELSRSSGI